MKRIRWALTALAGLFAVSVSAQSNPDPLFKLDPLARRAYEHQQAGKLAHLAKVAGVHPQEADPTIDLFIRTAPGVSRAQLQALEPSLKLRTQSAGHFTANVPIRLLASLAASGLIERLEASRKAHPTNDIARGSSTQASPFAYLGVAATDQGTAGYTNVEGSGVVVGIVDTGIDFRHPDFMTSTGTSRIQFIWDQTGSGSAPNGFSYGVEYTKSQIDQDLSISSCKSSGSGCTHVAEEDNDGHGTHVSGSAAGNGGTSLHGGSLGQYAGMAPQATIVFVKTDFGTTHITDGVNYIFQKAAALGLPAVVNLSLGSQAGPHDGTDGFDTTLVGLLGAGKLVSVAAGNDGDSGIHGGGTATSSLTLVSTVGTGGSDLSSSGGFFDIWHDSNDHYTVSVTVSGTGSAAVSQTSGGSTSGASGSNATVQISNDQSAADSQGGQEITVNLVPTSGSEVLPSGTTITITFTHTSGSGTGRVDAWSDNSEAFTTGLDNSRTVAEPGDAPGVITVGAYVTRTSWTCATAGCNGKGGTGVTYNPAPNLGDIAPFSSLGPNRIGTQKPDIAAPGMGIASTLSVWSSQDAALVVDNTSGAGHFIDQGTSMATPQITGILAMQLQENTSLTESGARTILQAKARSDTYASNGDTFGAGKVLGTPPAFPAASGISGTGTTNGINWNWTNNAQNELNVHVARSSDSVTLQSLSSGVTTWAQSGMSPNQAETVEIVEANDAGASTSTSVTAYSAAAVPGAPSTGTVFVTSMTVSWNANGNPGTTPFEVDYSTDNFADAVVAVPFSNDLTSNTTTLVNLNPGTVYQLRVRAENGQGLPTGYSGTGTATTLGLAPVGLAGSGTATTQIGWTWTAESGATSYTVYTATAGLLATTTTNAFTETVLGPNTSAQIELTATVAGQTSGFSAVSPVAYSLAATPTAPSFSAVYLSSVSASWASSNPAGTVFVAQLDPNDFSGSPQASSTTIAAPAAFTGLSPNTSYYLRVEAENGAGVFTAFSSPISTATLAAAPSGLLLDSATYTTAQVEWSANGNPSDTVYEVDISTKANPDGSAVSAFSAGLTTSSFTFTGLTANTSYYVAVRAENRFGLATAYSTPLQFFSAPTSASGSAGPGQGATISLRGVTISVPPGAFTSATTITLSIPGSLPSGGTHAGPLIGSGIGFTATPSGGAEPVSNCTTIVQYDPAVVAGAGIREQDLILARFDTTEHVWVPLLSSVDMTQKLVAAQTNHFSTFQLMGSPQSTGLNPDVIAFPNPVYTSRGQAMTFQGLASGQTLKIYTLTGRLVRSLSASGSLASWDGRNDSGTLVASGVYFVLIGDGSSTETIKVMVER